MSEMLTIAQAAERWGVHPSFIRGQIAAKRLRVYRAGRRIIRVAADDVDALFQPSF